MQIKDKRMNQSGAKDYFSY